MYACRLAKDGPLTQRHCSYIYWGNFEADTIGRAKLNGSHVNQKFIRTAAQTGGVTLRGEWIYWANYIGGDSIGRANISGKSVDNNFVKNLDGPTCVTTTPA